MKKKLLLLSLLLMPIIVFAEGGSSGMDPFAALFMEAFVSIHYSVFFIHPLAELVAPNNTKKVFWIFFMIRVGILLYCDFFVTPTIAILDFMSLFACAFIGLPIIISLDSKKKAGLEKKINEQLGSDVFIMATEEKKDLYCPSCGKTLDPKDKFCTNCGAEVLGNMSFEKSKKVLYSDFDSIYKMDEDACVEAFIKKEMKEAGFDEKTSLYPAGLMKKKIVMSIIKCLLIFALVVMVFFHFPIISYIIGIIIVIVVYKKTGKFDIVKYLTKKVKERPGEKISNIVMSEKENLSEDKTKPYIIAMHIVAFILPLVLFYKPVILYEKSPDGGYSVRFYAFGLTNFVSAEIPEEHNGEPVVGLRGNTFSNMFFLESVKLPDTITEIRGQAFKNCYNLKEVNIPEKLETIGGGAFANCKRIMEVEFPDTLTAMGGEIFSGATSLRKVRLSENITEIRGDSFSECVSLQSIEIPDRVERIGAHAFYHNKSLISVGISSNSKLKEIGSSAFRLCDSLSEIYIPADTMVNGKAFKESPTMVNRYSKNGEDNLNDYKLVKMFFVNSTLSIPQEDGDSIELKLVGIRVVDSFTVYSFEMNGAMYSTFELSIKNKTYTIGNMKIVMDNYSGDWVTVKIYY